MKFTVSQFCQNTPFRFSQSNIPVSCSQQQIIDRHAEHKSEIISLQQKDLWKEM
jgi:hypothetical protein